MWGQQNQECGFDDKKLWDSERPFDVFFYYYFFFVGEIDIDGAMTKHINCDLNANGPL